MIRDRYILNKQEGLVGVEIELEGDGMKSIDTLTKLANPIWRFEHDGSLRGFGAEAVFRHPLSFEDAKKELYALEKTIHDNKCSFLDSGRAGVHVHVNMQDKTMVEVYNFIVLYLIFEESLVQMCGDWRVGNLFCLRAKDAEGMLDVLLTAAKNDEWGLLSTDDIRYAAINVNAIPKYGSLEFRAMRSTTDAGLLTVWIRTLLALREAACKFDSPVDIIHEFSVRGPDNLHTDVFGDLPVELCIDSMYEGMALAQMLAFRVDWGKVKEPAPLPESDRGLLLEKVNQMLYIIADCGIEEGASFTYNTMMEVKDLLTNTNPDNRQLKGIEKLVDNHVVYLNDYFVLEYDEEDMPWDVEEAIKNVEKLYRIHNQNI